MKRRRWPLVGALIVASIGLGGGLWLSYRPVPKPPAPTISDRSPAQVRRIRVRRDGDLVVIARDGARGRWRLISPVNAAVDRARLRAVLSLLGHPARRRYNRRAIADATTGLGHPVLVVRFDQDAPIQIGGRGPGRTSRYVATAHALLLADLPDLATLERGWTHWVSPALVPPGRRLSRIVLANDTLTLDNHHWQAQPTGQRRSAAVAATAAAWQSARALTVVPADPARRRIARITLGFKTGPPRHLDVVERDPNLILRDPELGVDYHLAGNRVAPLLDLEHSGLTTQSG